MNWKFGFSVFKALVFVFPLKIPFFHIKSDLRTFFSEILDDGVLHLLYVLGNTCRVNRVENLGLKNSSLHFNDFGSFFLTSSYSNFFICKFIKTTHLNNIKFKWDESFMVKYGLLNMWISCVCINFSFCFAFSKNLISAYIKSHGFE